MKEAMEKALDGAKLRLPAVLSGVSVMSFHDHVKRKRNDYCPQLAKRSVFTRGKESKIR